MYPGDEHRRQAGSRQSPKSTGDAADSEGVRTNAPSDATALLDALWAARGALEGLLFSLGSVGTTLEAGEEQLLPAATTSLREAIERAHAADPDRAIMGSREGEAVEPLRSLLGEHWARVRELRDEIVRRAREQRDHVEILLHLLRRRCVVLESQAEAGQGPPDTLKKIELEEEILDLRLQELSYQPLLLLLRRLARAES